MSLDLAVIGIVFALILLIIFFSAVVLYLSFRIKETFRKETRKGFAIVKIGFLIGILFLAGGIFYFFAGTLTPAPNSNPYLSLTLSYPSSVAVDTVCRVNFTVLNPTPVTAHNATIQAGVFFADFLIKSSTHEVMGNIIEVGDVPSGTTIVSLELSTPSKPGTLTDTVTLLFQEMTAPVTQPITVSITGETNPTPSPSSSPTPLPSSTPTSDPVLGLTVSYPSSVAMNTNITMSFTIRNLASTTAHGVTIEAETLFSSFAIVSSTREVVGTVVNVGDVPPGATIIFLTLLSPNKPGTVTDTVNLLFQEMTAPVTQQVVITVRGGQ